MNNKSKTEYRIGVGASSVLMMLVVLALTAVSLLSFQSARNAEVLTKRNVDMTTAYYEASARVQQKLAVMDALLCEMQAEDAAVDAEGLKERLQSVEAPEFQVWQNGEEWAFSFVEDASYERQIEVRGSLTLSGAERYRISQYRLVSHPAEDEFSQFQLMGE